jgi:hypothetical protein
VPEQSRVKIFIQSRSSHKKGGVSGKLTCTVPHELRQTLYIKRFYKLFQTRNANNVLKVVFQTAQVLDTAT